MDTKDQLDFEMGQARQAKQLKNHFLDQFFIDKEQQLFNHIKNLPIGDVDRLVDAHHQLKSLGALRLEIETVVDTGKLAEAGLRELDNA